MCADQGIAFAALQPSVWGAHAGLRGPDRGCMLLSSEQNKSRQKEILLTARKNKEPPN
jgi:hypothetical protein